jgi:hypothetical protein
MLSLFAPQNNRKVAPQIRTGLRLSQMIIIIEKLVMIKSDRSFWLRIVTQTEYSIVTQNRQGLRQHWMLDKIDNLMLHKSDRV